jgi:hypothetical protein
MLHRSIPVGLALAALAAMIPSACSTSPPQCEVGADCASGVCESSGRCAPVSTTTAHDSGTTPTLDGSPVTTPDGGPSSPDGGDPGGDDTGSPVPLGDGGVCVPNDDGTIVREEFPMLAGLHANYEIAENVTVDTAGVTNADGSRAWDFSGALSGDHTVLVTTDDPSGQWFSSKFASATYTTKLSDTATLLGVLQGSQSALALLGVVSPTSGTGQTEVSYAPPADLMSVPMKLGTAWSSTSNVTGTAEGLVADYVEQYASKVDAYGTMKTPYGTFDVLRVQTTLTRTDLGVVTVTQSLSFVAECFGPVASVTSQTDETQTQFTHAAEVRRLTP